MTIDVDALKCLYTIHESGSFSAAAKRLGRVPSALTHTIKKLEYQVGFTIFDRSGHKAVLTKLGKTLLEESKTVFLALDHLDQKLNLKKENWETSFSMALEEAIPFKNILPLIHQFYEECPKIDLRIGFERLNGLWDALNQKRAQIAIGVTSDPPKELDYSIIPLGKFDMSFVCAPHHPLASQNNVTAQDIKSYPGAIVSDTTQYLKPRTTGVYNNQTHITVSSMQAKKDLILSGLATGYLHMTLIEKELASGELVAPQIDALKKSATYSIAWANPLDGEPKGKALTWWINKLSDPQLKSHLLTPL